MIDCTFADICKFLQTYLLRPTYRKWRGGSGRCLVSLVHRSCWRMTEYERIGERLGGVFTRELFYPFNQINFFVTTHEIII